MGSHKEAWDQSNRNFEQGILIANEGVEWGTISDLERVTTFRPQLTGLPVE